MSGLPVQEVVNKLPSFNETFIFSNTNERQEAIEAAAKLAASVWSSFLDPEMCTEDQREKLSSLRVRMSISPLPKGLPSESDRQTFYELLIDSVRDCLNQIQPYFSPGEYYSKVSLDTDYAPSGELSNVWSRANFPSGLGWENSLLPCKSSINIRLLGDGDDGKVTVSASFMCPLL